MKCQEFIAQHTHKNYCEIVISPTGDIEYAIPSHLYKMMAVSGKPREELKQIIPMRAAPLHWLIEYTGYGVCWFSSFILPVNYTKKQVAVIRRLMRAGIISSTASGKLTQEKSVCDAWKVLEETGDDTILYSLPELPGIHIRR